MKVATGKYHVMSLLTFGVVNRLCVVRQFVCVYMCMMREEEWQADASQARRFFGYKVLTERYPAIVVVGRLTLP